MWAAGLSNDRNVPSPRHSPNSYKLVVIVGNSGDTKE
jgi:hypothetical protein